MLLLMPVLVLVVILLCPDLSFAATQKLAFATIIGQLQKLVTLLLLPLAILINAWRIIYIAVVAGLMGMDPLNMVSDTDNDGEISSGEVVGAIKGHLMGFFHGLVWIGGLFIVFQVALTLAAMLATSVAEVFG